MRRIAKYLALAAVGVISALPTAAQPVKVGCLFPLTGPGGQYGRDSVVAVQMAQDQLYAMTPDGFPTLDVQIEDTRSKGLRSVQIARRLVETDQVEFLCGVVSSSVARAVSQEAAQQETFFIGTDHASPTLITEDLHPYYFRMNNGTRQSMLAGAKYIREHYATPERALKIAFIGPDYDYGYQAWDDLRLFLDQEAVAYEVVGTYWPKLFETDYSVYLHALMRNEIDIVVSGHWGLDLVTFIKQARQAALFETTQFMNFDAGGNFEVFAELGNDMPLGLVLSARHHVNWPDTLANQKFVEGFHARAGRYPSYAAQGAYAGIMAIATAVKTAGGTDDKTALRQALEGLSLALPEDPEGFQSVMDPKAHQILQVQAIGKTEFNNRYAPATVQLGQWSVYYPPEIWPLTAASPPE